MPVSNLLTTLIERLLDLTTEGRIAWQETASEDDFVANLSQYVVTISRTDEATGTGEARTPRYWIRVADREGTLVDSASDADFDDILTLIGMSPIEGLKRLFDAARRKALNVDKALSELIASLDSIGRSK